MPRPKRRRRVCCMPQNTEFTPAGKAMDADAAVVMTVDEYEAIRLIDHERMTQEECSGYMQISRTTVQEIYNRARQKLAMFLVEGKPLLIEGGEYRLCAGDEPCCGHGRCYRHQRGRSES